MLPCSHSYRKLTMSDTVNTVITDLGLQVARDREAAGEALVIDRVTLSDIGLAESIPAPDPTMTDQTNIVDTQPVALIGKVTPNAVARTIDLGTSVGDYNITQIGWRERGTGKLIALSNVARFPKRKSTPSQTGNIFRTTWVWNRSRIAALCQVTLPAQSWQLDYTARFKSIEEADRKGMREVCGRFAALHDGLRISAVEPESLDGCESTTGWSSTAGTVALNATDFAEGTKSVQISGHNEEAELVKTLGVTQNWRAKNGLTLRLKAEAASVVSFFVEDSQSRRNFSAIMSEGYYIDINNVL